MPKFKCQIVISLFIFILLNNMKYITSYDKLLKIQISELAPTRIIFDAQKIVDVFYYPENAAKVILHRTGAVFVIPNKSNSHIYLTLINESGHAQDLRLKFSYMQPEPITLKLDNNSFSTSKGKL